jgi:hypothetical protein
MPVEAYVADRWKENADTSVQPDGILTILYFESGNSMEDIAEIPEGPLRQKIRGNVRNLGMWRAWLGDATWTEYATTNLVWWLVYYVRDAQGEIVSTNAETTLTNPEWNSLTSYLTGNGFSITTLGRNDTRGVLKDKVLAIFQQQ